MVCQATYGGASARLDVPEPPSAQGSMPWTDMLRGHDGGAESSAGAGDAQRVWDQQPDAKTRDSEAQSAWTPGLQAAVTAFWRRRGVGDDGVARCLAMAQQHPEHRDLALLKERMAVWDEVQRSCPRGVDVNRLIRNDSKAIMLDPRVWFAKARILCAAYPDIDWYRVMEEHPCIASMQHWELSHALNGWAASLTMGGDLGF